MQERINNFLKRPFPLFLLNGKGRVYYFRMIVIFVVLANIIKPFGFINSKEYHKSLVLSVYIGMFFGLYILVHQLFSYLRPHYYNLDKWTIKKEFHVLMYFIPTTALSTCLFVNFAIPEFELSLTSFIELQFYNFILSFISIPTFGYFVDTKLITTQPIEPIDLAQPIEPTLPSEPKENTKSKSHLTEDHALRIMHQLKELMDTQQLYLSKKCSLQHVVACSGIPRHHISEAINFYSEYNFNDFINKYRVDHVCRLLQNGQKQHLKLEAIGRDCGFGSRSSFYNAFKMFTGKTTSEYLADQQNQNAASNSEKKVY